MMQLHWLDIGMLLLYLLGMAATGLYFSRRNVSTEEYFVGGRSFPGWVIGLSMAGTAISSITFIAMPADSFKTSWIRFIPYFAMPFAALFAARFIVPFFRRGPVYTAFEYLETRFGPGIRVYAALAYGVVQLTRISMVLYLVSLMLHEVTGLSPTACILLGGGFVALYTIVGGIDAVIWTDVVQTIVLALGSVICLGVIIAALPGGLGEIIDTAAAHGKFGFAELVGGKLIPIDWGFSISEKTGTMIFLLGVLWFLTEYSSSQHWIQRYCAAKSANEARKALYVAVAASVPIWFFFNFLGTSLFVFFEVFPAPAATDMLTGAARAEGIVPYFVMHHLPPGLAGLVIAAALAAAMSSLDSSINAISAVGVVDLYQRHIASGRSDRHYLRVAWVIAAGASLVMLAGAILLLHSDTKTLQDTSIIIASLAGGGLFSIYFLGFFTNRGDARSIGLGIAFTLAFTGWTLLDKAGALPASLAVPFDLYYTSTIGNALMFVVGFTAGTFLPARERDLTNLTHWRQDGSPLD
jgi:SSS family solute:Na+ symporter